MFGDCILILYRRQAFVVSADLARAGKEPHVNRTNEHANEKKTSNRVKSCLGTVSSRFIGAKWTIASQSHLSNVVTAWADDVSRAPHHLSFNVDSKTLYMHILKQWARSWNQIQDVSASLKQKKQRMGRAPHWQREQTPSVKHLLVTALPK